jgi:predicted dehydrogenase
MHPTYDGSQPITIYGESGTLRLPDPNLFDGPIHLRSADDPDWSEIPPATPTGYSRGIGVAEMVTAIQEGKPFRATAAQAMYVLDLMQGFLDSAESGRTRDPHKSGLNRKGAKCAMKKPMRRTCFNPLSSSLFVL